MNEPSGSGRRDIVLTSGDIKESVLFLAEQTINQDRLDAYGNPEDSFVRIARYWEAYWRNKGYDIPVFKEDVAMLMTLFKIAREQGPKRKKDNVIDAIGYLGIYGDRLIDG